MLVNEFFVEMTCGKCERAIRKELGECSGTPRILDPFRFGGHVTTSPRASADIEEVTVDLSNQIVRVTSARTATELRSIMERSGQRSRSTAALLLQQASPVRPVDDAGRSVRLIGQSGVGQQLVPADVGNQSCGAADKTLFCRAATP
jgi:copper chaperone CopZ